MSKRPLRVTGFARFFLVMLLIAPLAYIGASYYNGQDGIQKLKSLLNLDKNGSASANAAKESAKEGETLRVNEAPSNQALQAENLRLQEELEFKKKRTEELYRENEELKRKLESAEKALDEAKK